MDTVIHSDNDFATVAYLRIKSGTLEGKTSAESIDPVIPNLLEEAFEEVRSALEQSLRSASTLDDKPEYAPDDAVA